MKIPKTKIGKLELYGVKYKGKWNMFLNTDLVSRQNITVKDIDLLKKIHVERLKLFDKMSKEKDVEKLRNQAKELEKIEFRLQKAWKFEEDSRYHSWWRMAPQCKCPQMDNEDRIGTKDRVHSSECPIHGKKAEGKVVKKGSK